MHHDLKIHPQHYAAKRRKQKAWEIRQNDRDFQTGDTVTFREWNPDTESFTGKCPLGAFTIVGPVVINAAGLQPGFCIFQHTPNVGA